MADADLRADISAVVADLSADQAPAVEAPEPVAEAVETAPETETQAEARARDDRGRFAKAAEKAAEKAAQAAPSVAVAPPVGTPPAEPAAQAAPALKAPQSWKPAAREAFAKAPREVQEEALRRETETAAAIRDAAPAKQIASEFQEMVRPYEMLMRAAGRTPIQSISGLLQTAAALQTGPAPTKAQIVAQLIVGHGIDINMLAAALNGQTPQQSAQNFDPQSIIRQAKEELARDLQARQSATVNDRLTRTLEEFSNSHEFYNDVQDTMTAIITGWQQTGKINGQSFDKTLQRAYDIAIGMDPEIAGIQKQKAAVRAATTAQAATQRARTAGSSVRPSPAAKDGIPGEDEGSLRGDIKAAIAHHSGR